MKNVELDKNDIMNDTEKKSVKNECENTGKKRKYPIRIVDGKKIWFKFCPKCGREQKYSTLRAASFAFKKNRICLFCKNSGKNNPFYNKHHTEEHKQFLSLSQLKTCSNRFKKEGCNPPKIEKSCKRCKSRFLVVKSKIESKYCSYNCALFDNFGFSPDKKTKPELKFEEFLKSKDIDYISSYPLEGKLYDFYIPSKKLLIEIDGIYWHGKGLKENELNETQKRNKHNDNIKTCIAHKNGYLIGRIWEDEISEATCIKIFTSTEEKI